MFKNINTLLPTSAAPQFLLWATAFALLFSTCKKDPLELPNEEEVITSVTLTFIPKNGGATKKFSYTDLDGDGANAPIIKTDTLVTNTIYNVSATFLNESVNPAKDITAEISTEGTDHQLFYLFTPENLFAQSYADKDANNFPIGLQTIIETKAGNTGKLKLVLRHKPNKQAPNVATGNIENASGETDIEINFDFTVQ